MPIPAITLTGTLEDIYGAKLTGGSVVIQLAGFGSQLPRVSGTAMLARTAPLALVLDNNAHFSTLIFGNDVITPAGTYYVVQMLDDARNVVQANAYQFAGGSGGLDISTVAPFNPNAAVVVSGPVIFGALVTIPWAANLNINGSQGTTFDITLTGNVVTDAMSNVVPGTIYTFIIVQDAVGGRAWVWPNNVKDAQAPSALANSINIQSFVARANGNLYPIGPMTVN